MEKEQRITRIRRALAARLAEADRLGGLWGCSEQRGLTRDTLRRALAELDRIESDPAYARAVARDNRWVVHESPRAGLMLAFHWRATETVAADEWAAIAACCV